MARNFIKPNFGFKSVQYYIAKTQTMFFMYNVIIEVVLLGDRLELQFTKFMIAILNISKFCTRREYDIPVRHLNNKK